MKLNTSRMERIIIKKLDIRRRRILNLLIKKILKKGYKKEFLEFPRATTFCKQPAATLWDYFHPQNLMN